MNVMPRATALTIAVDESGVVSGILQAPADARACYVMAHGAGAGMNHSSSRRLPMASLSGISRRLATNSPTWSEVLGDPIVRLLAYRTVRAAVIEAARQLPALPLIAGGKSFGSRMTSQAQAEAPLPKVEGLAFLAFRCIRPTSPRSHVRGTSTKFKFRCSFYRARGMRWPT
jgi:predicted alpha/beta-hydrolase family hydrolase